MSNPRYLWRQLTPEQQKALLDRRQAAGNPWHSPPHRPNSGKRRFQISAACFEHRPHIGFTPERLERFCTDLLTVLTTQTRAVFAWCVLPNHYHALIETEDVLGLLRELGRLHGRTSHAWNGEENLRGRKVFYRSAERAMRSERHFFATLNYVHHNPVHHGYVQRWTDWIWSSGRQYLERMGPGEAERIWGEFPVLDYGRGWDDPEL